MEIFWGLLLPAAVLGCYPIDRWLPRHVKFCTSDALLDPAAKRRRGWWLWQPCLWLDVARIALAAWLIDYAFLTATETHTWIAALIVGVVLAVGVCCQMWTRREEDSVLAPITYLTGITVALLPVGPALAVLVLSITAMIAFRSYIGFLLTGMLLTSGLTFLLGGEVETGLIVSFVNAVALIAGLLIRGEFVLPISLRSNATKTPTPAR